MIFLKQLKLLMYYYYDKLIGLIAYGFSDGCEPTLICIAKKNYQELKF